MSIKSIFHVTKRPSEGAVAKLIFLGGFAAYLVYHLLQGNRGLLALFKMKEVVREEQGILAKLEHENTILANNIKLLRPQSLDIDMLDERVREVLNLARDDEVIIRNSP
ncbi:MAG: septum formation initiator family protein [Holosporales bacterium]|jgi:cell division protein FtsB|nr:septum formation initiator family protein [Holosporales bacterium]